MCTAITYQGDDFYFGRTLDYEHSFGENVVITPRNYVFKFRDVGVMQKHYAIIGMAHLAEDFPLYYDAVNEKGLCIAALNFVSNAYYREKMPHKDNVAHFELIPWLLGQCATISQVKEKLKSINVTDTAFSSGLKVAELHWIIADKSECITIESVKDGLKFYQNPVGVLTNNPPFPEQMFNLKNYMHLSPNPPKNHFSKALDLLPYSRGMGALGLPGDLSSQSRFVRAAFTKLNSQTDNKNAVSQFFHILGTVNQVSGCCITEKGDFEKTIYTSCSNADKGIYYYTTYHNRQITAIDIHQENLDSDKLITFPLQSNEQIHYQNKK